MSCVIVTIHKCWAVHVPVSMMLTDEAAQHLQEEAQYISEYAVWQAFEEGSLHLKHIHCRCLQGCAMTSSSTGCQGSRKAVTTMLCLM